MVTEKKREQVYRPPFSTLQVDTIKELRIMRYFVQPDSIVRKIWGKSDTILVIFAGASAEFALNKAVDWLYFTGKLPADPIGRLFSTVTYAQQIVFAQLDDAYRAIDRITTIHQAVENSRKSAIPDWAYRDVLYMLIHYSVAAYELLERKLSPGEKDDVYDVFRRLGARMNLKELPGSYNAWTNSYRLHLQNDLAYSNYTKDLFRQYRKHLGSFRYWLLVETQKAVVPGTVRELLQMNTFAGIRYIIPQYKLCRRIGLDRAVRSLLLPKAYKQRIDDLDQ